VLLVNLVPKKEIFGIVKAII